MSGGDVVALWVVALGLTLLDVVMHRVHLATSVYPRVVGVKTYIDDLVSYCVRAVLLVTLIVLCVNYTVLSGV